MPRLVAMYLLAVTRDTVDSCISIASATVLRLSGRRCATPRAKNASCWRTISLATLRMVLARWSSARTSQVADCLQTATWLVRALDQRAKTILKVAKEIVRQQDAFFARGVAHLRPLNLKTVADAIEMHESTVSRVTANKYMATSRGIFELKYFFTSAIAAADGGEAHSAESVRHRIKQLIDAESADNVFSDDTIVEKLRESGIAIARRTVAKYREAMRIPSSVQRRRDKQPGPGTVKVRG